MKKRSVLVVEDEDNIATLIRDILDIYDIETTIAYRGNDALKALDGQSFDFAVADISLPDMNGLDFYNTAVKSYPEIQDRFIFMSGYEPDRSIREMLDNSKNCFIQKPFHLSQFRKLIEEWIS